VLAMLKAREKMGLGSISLILCIAGILFSFSFGSKWCLGDIILKFIRLKPIGKNGIHYTVFYSLIFFVPSAVIGYKSSNTLNAKLGKIISSIILIFILLSVPGLTF
jgi:hypothetical protein